MAHRARWHTASERYGVPGIDGGEYAQQIDKVYLPTAVREHVETYDRIIGDREPFLWKWFHNLSDEFALSSIAPDAMDAAREQKTLLTILVTTLDDLAEKDGATATFQRARRELFEAIETDDRDRTDADSDVLAFVEELWTAIDSRLRNAPRYDEFADVFEYDLRQTVNAMDYSRVLNDNATMANRTEAERFDAYNMAMFPYADVDLMHSPTFQIRELGALRSLLCELQQMARIGNWLTTWERELAEGDFSSGITVCALRRGVIQPAELQNAGEETVERLVQRIRSHGIESEFVRDWQIRNKAVRKSTGKLRSVDAGAIIDGLEAVMNHHLASDGYK